MPIHREMPFHRHQYPALPSSWDLFNPSAAGLDVPLWGSLDIILHNLAGKYQPRNGGDRMLVKLWGVNLDPSEAGILLWRYRERGILKVDSRT